MIRDEARYHAPDDPMRSLLSFQSAVLILILFYPVPSYDQSTSDAGLSTVHQGNARVLTVIGKGETRPEPSKETLRDSDYRPAREIKKFIEPTMLLRGTAEGIGLDSHTLDGFLETKFLQNFGFLQSDFAFDKTYETWEIGLFECEAWTVGSNYPIAFHVQCAGGSMDEPRHWRTATLGYGPKERILDMVKTIIDSIVDEYATFVQKARSKNGS